MIFLKRSISSKLPTLLQFGLIQSAYLFQSKRVFETDECGKVINSESDFKTVFLSTFQKSGFLDNLIFEVKSDDNHFQKNLFSDYTTVILMAFFRIVQILPVG